MNEPGSKIINTLIFIGLFTIISFEMHSYIFHRFADYGYIKFSIITVIILTFSFIITTILQNRFSNVITRALYILASVWAGAGFVIFYITALMHLIQYIFRITDNISAIIIIISTLILVAYGIINATNLRIKKIDINIGLGKSLKVIQLSDIHMGAVNRANRLKKIVDKVNNINPEIIFITGDLVDGSGKLEPKVFDSLKKLKSKTFFIAGNHEFYEGIENVKENIKNSGLIFLRNQTENYKGMQIIGVDYDTNNNYLEKTLSKLKLNKNKPKILLYHTPTEIEATNKYGINLQLSGHTHNGQIFPINIIARIFYKYIKGLYKYKNTQIYVSQGTGTWGPPMRIFTQNEITEINLS